MNTKEFIKKRKRLLAEKAAADKVRNEKYTVITQKFIQENSPVELHKVYELQKNGNKRRGFRRFVIYDQYVRMLGEDHPIITVGGWWLNENNIPTKWDTMTVFGIGNPAVFTLSGNQKSEEHPDADKESEKESENDLS